MADFFEEFGRMVSDVASDITKKTGDTLETVSYTHLTLPTNSRV